MGRRTKDEIAADNEMTCSKRGCNKVHDEVFAFTSYCKEAVLQDLHEESFCEEHFKEIEKKLKIS